MRVTGDRGQTASSYLGMLVVVAAIIAGIFAVGSPGDIAGGIEQAICRITSLGEAGACSDDGDEVAAGRPDPETGLTPREQAEAGDYVAIGDSFSSGEGAHDYDPATDTDDNRCHRSDNSYSSAVTDSFDFGGETRIVTCSGAKANNVLETGQNGEPAQIDAVDDDTSLVTIGIGGNDADWVPVIINCLKNDADGCRSDEAAVRQRVEEAAERAGNAYEEARRRAGDDARIVAVGYPRFFPDEPTAALFEVGLGCVTPPFGETRCAKRFSLTPEEQRYMNELTREFNDLLEEQAADADVEFVDMNDAFDGHEFGTEDPYFNALELGTPDCWDPTAGDCWKSIIKPETSHPNAAGQRRMGELVTAQIENP